MKAIRKDLYERLGGAPILEALVIGLYSRIIEDPLLSPFFSGLDIVSVMKSQRNFLAYALSEPAPETDRILRRAHAPLLEQGLSDKHFDALKEHFFSACAELRVSRSLIDECLGFIETTRASVLGR